MVARSLFTLCVILVGLIQVYGELEVKIVKDGSYNLSVNGKVWLPNGPAYFYANGQKYTSHDGSLKFIEYLTTSGEDKLGNWNASEFIYLVGNNIVTASIKLYEKFDIVVFSQKYGNFTSGTTSGDSDSLSSAFPSFKIIGEPGELAYISYGGSMFGGAYKYGRWTSKTTKVNSGLGGGPIVLFDHDGNVIVMSVFSEFLSSSVYQSTDDGTVNWGIMGGVNDIPAMYETSTILYYGSKGINQGMTEWGSIMRQWYGRDQSYVDADFTLNYLGYWMDDGAYYWYVTEANKTYEDTIIDVKTYADEVGIPYRYVQYDCWRYREEQDNSGTMTWGPLPSVFPHGMQYLYNKTGWPVSAQNRFWSAKTPYAKQNGGKYNFIVEAVKSIPQDETFWSDMLREARKWGLITYEQDWLDVEFMGLNATTQTLNVGRDWLMQMAEGAAKNDIKLQYCMSYPREGLQTLQIPMVTQARVSSDYHDSPNQWNIGLNSIFADALGIRPSKDNFWTSYHEPGNGYAYEKYTELESVIATLSTGPVGPSDMVGGSNVSLIMMSCTKDGRLLQPSRPAKNIDKNILQKTFADGSGPDGEVWSTWSIVSGHMFGTILAPTQTDAVQVTPSEAGFGQNFPSSVIFKHTWPTPESPSSFTDSSPLTIQNCALSSPCLWHSSPVFQLSGSTVFFYGELQKWVPMSPKRVTNIEISDDIYVTVIGAVEEVIEFSFGTYGAGAINTITCNLGGSGSAVIQHLAKSCRPL